MTPNSAAREYRFGIRVPILVAVAFERHASVDRDRRHPRRDLARIRRHVELGDGVGSAAAAADVIPVALAADAERRDHADAGDDDAGGRRCRHRPYNMRPCMLTRPRDRLSRSLHVGRCGGFPGLAPLFSLLVFRYVRRNRPGGPDGRAITWTSHCLRSRTSSQRLCP